MASMTANKRALATAAPSRWYRGANIPMRVIRRFARQVADHFCPDKIILFGSYAYGRPHADSDVDILVVMPARNQLDQAFRIHTRIDPPFPVDIIVRTPRTMRWQLAEGDSFLGEIVSKGKVLYEKTDGCLGEKSRGRLRARSDHSASALPRSRRRLLSLSASGKKYLKALLVELGLSVPRTHNLDDLHRLLYAHHPIVRSVRRGLMFLSDFAVDVRYPGDSASNRQAAAAIRWARGVRKMARSVLGLPLAGKNRRRKPTP
jgi:predicted nucleotidyltransferase